MNEIRNNFRMEGNTMLQNISVSVKPGRKKFIRLAALVLSALFCGASFAPTFAQQQGQQTFASLEDAGQSLFSAMQAPDDSSLLMILGPVAKDIISSGDAAEDLDARTSFYTKYEEMHRL